MGNNHYEEAQEKVCIYEAVIYRAKSWNTSRRVIIKAEVTAKRQNVCFVVSDMEEEKAIVLYQQIYCHRGASELFIKEHKLYLKSDRTSCHRFEANQFRLFLHSSAYVLFRALRAHVLKHIQWAHATVGQYARNFLRLAHVFVS